MPVIVLTGGPCGGKSTALCYIEEKLRDMGYTVFAVPEGATHLMRMGIRPVGAGLTVRQFQELVFLWQLQNQAFYANAARISSVPEKKKIILYDRGFMDVSVYTEGDDFRRILTEHGLSIPDVRDSFYDAIFHLRTAALGAAQYYTTKNNKFMRETPEEARQKDAQTLAAWRGHPHLRIIDNSTDFEGKMKRLLKQVCHVLGIPEPLEIERKFLVKAGFDPASLRNHVACQKIDITQAYLPASHGGGVGRIRKRGQNGSFVYYQTHKQATGDPSVRIETERHITENEFRRLWEQRDPGCYAIQKERHCFVFNEQYFELDRFLFPHTDMCVLEIELTDKNDVLKLPPFIPIEKEVTEDPSYTNHALAKMPSVSA